MPGDESGSNDRLGRSPTDDARPPSDPTDDGIVLVVDDDEAFADTVAYWLEAEWSPRVAYDGREAIEAYGPHVDVVLLDRRMPALSGDEALSRIREREGSCRVAMMTAVEPEWDILEMNFDMYLEKPLTRGEVHDAVEELLRRAAYEQELRALFSLSEKLATLRSAYPEHRLEEEERYRRLREEIDRLHRQSLDRLGSVDDERFRELIQVVEDAP